uniref:Nardilysin-like n=1 Tax=Mesocestoides corti TaxID=53468 RepID=A0A5K3EJK6_MESCO
MIVNNPNSWNGIHLEGLLMNKFPTITPIPTIRLVRQPKENEDPKMIVRSGCKSTRLITDEFVTINPSADIYKNLRHIVIEAVDMKTAVVNPIDYLDSENEELAMLKDNWTLKDNPQYVTKRLESLSKNMANLKHALKFNQVRTVIFVSHSADTEESNVMVQKCVEFVNRALQREAESNATPSRPVTSVPGFVCRLPNLPCLLEAEERLKEGNPTIVNEARCIRFPPSNKHNGFFIACLKKELLLVTQPELPPDDEEKGAAVPKKAKKAKKGK